MTRIEFSYSLFLLSHIKTRTSCVTFGKAGPGGIWKVTEES